MSTASELKKLKVQELRDELEKRGLDASGVKAVLLERLEEAVKNEEKVEDLSPEEEDVPLEEVPPAIAEELQADDPKEEEAQLAEEQPEEEAGEILEEIVPEEETEKVEEDELEKMRKRAERFGMTFSVSEKQRKAMRARRFGLDNSLEDVMTERKRNFNADKKKNKKSRSGDPTRGDFNEQSNPSYKRGLSEAMKKRAERFGLPVKDFQSKKGSAHGADKRNAPTVDPEWEAKKKARAERFGIPMK